MRILPKTNPEPVLSALLATAAHRSFDELTLATVEESMEMKIHRAALVVTAICALAGVPFFSGLARAADKHAAEALEHAKEAVSHGKQGHGDVMKKHAEEALRHAKGANKNPHMDKAITHLNQAVANALKVEIATQHAEEAVTHLSEVK